MMTHTLNEDTLDARMASADHEDGLRELYYELDRERDARTEVPLLTASPAGCSRQICRSALDMRARVLGGGR
jgi:hypothetical protein